MIWSIIQVVGRQGASLVIFAILALLLNPEDFGILGMATAWIAFIQSFSEMGFGSALIQRQNVNSKHFSTTFFINLTVGILLTAIGIILSWPCALFFKTPAVQPIMAVLSLNFIVISLSLTQTAIVLRGMRFRDLAVRDISAVLIGGTIGIVCALTKFGVWSLVIQTLVSSVVGTILIWNISQWRPSFQELSYKHFKELWPYSSKLFAFSILKYFAQNTDKLIIGYFLGGIALGLYTFAYKVMVRPVSALEGAIGNYLFPKFSKIQKDLISIKSLYLFVNKTMSGIVAPAMVAIAVLSPTLTPAVFGQKWSPAVPLTQIVAILAVVILWISPVGVLMKSLNRPGWLLKWSVLVTILTSLFVWLGSNFGIAGATAGLVAAYIVALPFNFLILSRLIAFSFKDILNSYVPALLSSLVMGLILSWMMGFDKLFGSFKIGISLFTAAISYIAILMLIDRPFLIVLLKKSRQQLRQLRC